MRVNYEMQEVYYFLLEKCKRQGTGRVTATDTQNAERTLIRKRQVDGKQFAEERTEKDLKERRRPFRKLHPGSSTDKKFKRMEGKVRMTE